METRPARRSLRIREPLGSRSCRGRPEPLLGFPLGESDWVRNLRAAGAGELSSKGRTEVFYATEVPVDEREAIIARYRDVAGSHVDPYFTKLPDPKDHPVFQSARGTDLQCQPTSKSAVESAFVLLAVEPTRCG